MLQPNLKLPLYKTWQPGQKIDAGNRIASMVCDHFIMTIIAMSFMVPQIINDIISQPPYNSNYHFTFPYFAAIGFALYFCKDCINGRSPAKRYFHFQVVNNKTGLAASSLRCFVRNVFCIFWFIEGFVVMANTSRRLGDRVAGTKLVYYDDTVEQPKLNIIQIMVAFALSYGLMYLVCLPMISWSSLNIK